MNKEKCISIYSKQEFLNPDESPSVGTISCFIGYFPDKEKQLTEDNLTMWLRLGDCHVISCLHKSDFEYTEDFIKKMEHVRDFVDNFIEKLNDFKNGNV